MENKLCSKFGNRLVWSFDGEKMVIEPCGTNSLRVRAVPMGDIYNNDFAIIEPSSNEQVNIQIDQDSATITNGKIMAKVTNKDEEYYGREKIIGRVTFYREGKKILEEINNNGKLKLKARDFKSIGGDNYKLKMTFSPNENEHLYGMGQYQDGQFNLKGSSRELVQRNSQVTIPFYISNLNYGFLWNNPSIGESFFGLNKTVWVSQETKQLDYWITAGGSPKDILEQYSEVTGRAPKMPEYGLGLWQSKSRYYNQQQVVDIAKKYSELDVPLDVLIIDWFHWKKLGDYSFDERFFDDPEQMTKNVNGYGTKTMVSIWPQVSDKGDYFDDLKNRGMLVKNNQGLQIQMDFKGDSRFLDFTNPNTRKYFWNLIRQNYQKKGVSLFWLDEAEPEFSVYDFKNYRYYIGSASEYSNIYPFYYIKTFYEGMYEDNKEKNLSLVRSAWAGSQRFGSLVWSGDVSSKFSTLKKQVTAGLQIGLSGIPWWTTDTGGFSGGDISDPSFKELLVRWFEFSTFSPVLRMHGERLPKEKVTAPDGSEIFSTGAPNEIWSFGQGVFDILKKFVSIRTRLKPYLNSVMDEAHYKGYPVMRTLFFVYPSDNNCWDKKDQYMLGDKLLVAPILEEKSSTRMVYLPSNVKWYSLNDGKIYNGGKEYEVTAQIDEIPLFTQYDNKGLFSNVEELLRRS